MSELELAKLDKLLVSSRKDLNFFDDPNFKGHCQKCEKPVYKDDVIYFTQDEINYHFHQACFVCQKCNIQLHSKKEFLLHNEQPSCLDCYGGLAFGMCKACGKFLCNTGIIKTNDAQYHPECFVCGTCKSPLQNKYMEHGGKFLCSTCHEDTFPICSKCREKIKPDQDGNVKSVIQKDKRFHEGCFVCSFCSGPFKDLKAHTIGTSLACGECFGRESSKRAHELATSTTSTSVKSS